LTQGKVAIIDDREYELVNKYKWHAHFKHGKWDAATAINYSTLTMGRLLLGLMPGDKKRMEYLNGDKLDNRRANIRIEVKNRAIFYDDYVEIDVGHGLKTIVDKADYDLIKDYTWFAAKNTDKIRYAQTNIKKDGKYTIIHLHWLILSDIPIGMVRDHINGDGLDNRRDNLRICKPKHNSRNQKRHRDAVHSKYKGVTYNGQSNRRRPWVSRIIVDYKQIYLGYYETELEAAKAYDVGAKRYFGEYARLNFPNG